MLKYNYDLEEKINGVDGQVNNKEKLYYVVEFWSKEYNKWVMIDFIDKRYFDNEGFPCSVM